MFHSLSFAHREKETASLASEKYGTKSQPLGIVFYCSRRNQLMLPDQFMHSQNRLSRTLQKQINKLIEKSNVYLLV